MVETQNKHTVQEDIGSLLGICASGTGLTTERDETRL